MQYLLVVSYFLDVQYFLDVDGISLWYICGLLLVRKGSISSQGGRQIHIYLLPVSIPCFDSGAVQNLLISLAGIDVDQPNMQACECGESSRKLYVRKSLSAWYR